LCLELELWGDYTMEYRKVHIKWNEHPLCGLIVQGPKLVDVVECATCQECLKMWKRKKRIRA